MKKERDTSPLRQENIFVCLLLFVWLIIGLLYKSEPGKDQWNSCKVLRVKF